MTHSCVFDIFDMTHSCVFCMGHAKGRFIFRIQYIMSAQNSPVYSVEGPCTFRRRALYISQKCPVYSAKEPCTFYKRALYIPQKCPSMLRGALLRNTQGSFVECTGLFCGIYRALLMPRSNAYLCHCLSVCVFARA